MNLLFLSLQAGEVLVATSKSLNSKIRKKSKYKIRFPHQIDLRRAGSRLFPTKISQETEFLIEPKLQLQPNYSQDRTIHDSFQNDQTFNEFWFLNGASGQCDAFNFVCWPMPKRYFVSDLHVLLFLKRRPICGRPEQISS